MFDVEELLSEENQRKALEHFSHKRDGCGPDGMHVSELADFWELNHEKIENEIRNGQYRIGMVKCTEIINRGGKKRVISSLNVTDRFIARLLSQKMKQYWERDFCENSYAYQEGKGILDAVRKAGDYLNSGDVFVIKLDIQDFFDCIPLDVLFEKIKLRVSSPALRKLIYDFLHCTVLYDEKIKRKKTGLVQGNPVSPILSNLYLDSLDQYMDEREYHWIRFADDISVYFKTEEECRAVWTELVCKIKENHLNVNMKKSGIFTTEDFQLLGYDFASVKGKIEIRKHKYRKEKRYSSWHPSALQKVNQEYHLVNDGILNKQDYTLLFENEEEKHHIPVEVVQQLNVYGNITLSSGALKTVTDKNIRVGFYNQYGEIMGYYFPHGFTKTPQLLIKQCLLYENREKHLRLAKDFESACLHNIRSNIRYYSKRKKNLMYTEEKMDAFIESLEGAKDLNELLLIEARARELYYRAFNHIIDEKDFIFVKRSRRPPKDAINAMISFGNTLLYNRCLRAICKTTLDVRIGILHAANNRSQTLNLDFADLFKPVIVDRVIFTLLNRHWINKEEHFVFNENGSVLLNKEGKRIFIEAFEDKMAAKIVVKNKVYKYWQLIENEIRQYQKCIVSGGKYKPYKYY